MKTFSGDWLITDTMPNVTTGLLVTSEGNDALIITDLSSSIQKKVSRSDLVGNNKYRCDILHLLQETINISKGNNKFVNHSAAQLIDEICEANRLLYWTVPLKPRLYTTNEVLQFSI